MGKQRRGKRCKTLSGTNKKRMEKKEIPHKSEISTERSRR